MNAINVKIRFAPSFTGLTHVSNVLAALSSDMQGHLPGEKWFAGISHWDTCVKNKNGRPYLEPARLKL